MLTHLNTGENNRPELELRFSDLHPALNVRQAVTESQRCLYCFDAPCARACPAGIDVPAFIANIAQGSPNGAAQTILDQNILGGSCARVCPTEILCEHACVHNHHNERPIQIGLLQRHALDHARFSEHPFQRAAATGRHIGIVGAGPAGLACAHQLALLGNDVTIFEAENKPGGLNEFGVARYKLTNDYAQKEIEFLLKIGGIQIQYGQRLGLTIHLTQLTEQFDAVFLAGGLGAVRKLELDRELSPGIVSAPDYIKVLRQTDDLTQLPVPNSCIILGAGNTAIDMAIQIRLLGAQQVTLVYRRGAPDISATDVEFQLALQHQVQLICWAQPVEILLNERDQVSGMRFEKTAIINNQLCSTGHQFDLPAQAVFKAIGQKIEAMDYPDGALRMEYDKIWVDADFQTSMPSVYAGGDCVAKDPDLTVYAVQHGKLAARAIHNAIQHSEDQHG